MFTLCCVLCCFGLLSKLPLVSRFRFAWPFVCLCVVVARPAFLFGIVVVVMSFSLLTLLVLFAVPFH